MEPVSMNYLAMVVAAVAHTILGALWYAPFLFGNAWMKAIGKTKEQVAADYSPWKIVGALIGSFFVAYGIARILTWIAVDPAWGGFGVALLAAICFVAATAAVNDLMEGRPCKLFFINAFYNIVGFVIMGLIIGFWR